MSTLPELEISKEFLWDLLTSEEQLDAARCFWAGRSPSQQLRAPEVTEIIAGLLSFREKFVRERPLEWRAQELRKRLDKPPLEVFIDDVLREFLLQRKRDMVCAILDAEGTPHTNDGLILETAAAPTADVFVRGLAGVRNKFPERDLVLYYGTHVLTGEEHWGALEKAFEHPEFKNLGQSLLGCASRSETGVPAEEKAAADNGVPSDSAQGFTTLDNVLIKTVVATAVGVDGALPPDALEDLIQEVLALDADRHRSYFHLGYSNALLEKPFQGEFTGANSSRRGWSLTGFLMGSLRSSDPQRACTIVKEQRRHWEEFLESGPMAGRVMLLPHLVSRFAEAQEWRLLTELFEASAFPSGASRAVQVCRSVYEIAAGLVRRGNSVEALPILQALYRKLGDVEELPEEFLCHLKSASLRKMGQAHLRAGRFREAKRLLQEALKETDFPEAANAETDLGLAAAGFRSLDFLLPKEDERSNKTTIQALERQGPHFQSALKCQGRATNAHFVLALIAFHRGRIAEAEEHLSSSLAGMLPKCEAYQTAFLLDWTRFLLAIVISEQCEPARLHEIRTHVDCAIASPALFPLHLWSRLGRSLSLYDDQSLAESVIQHVLKKRGDSGYALLKESGVLTRNRSLRSTYRHWLDTQQHSPRERVAELETLFTAALNDRDSDEITDLLDALEGVAKTDEACIPRVLHLLASRRSEILSVWGESDVDNLEAGLFERSGRFPECLAILQRMFYRFRADEDWVAVENVLDRAEDLCLPDFDVGKLRAQAEHLRPPETLDSSSELCLGEVRVLYVGGNETQARYEKAIREELRGRHPGLSVTFYFPGWTSNWNVHLENLRRELPKHDVVVINTFVRTQLGRSLRATCGSDCPWRACTGHGRKSLLNAIESAAAWAVKRGGLRC